MSNTSHHIILYQPTITFTVHDDRPTHTWQQTIDGQGSAWWVQPDNWRPRLIYLSNADNVIISNTTFINSPYHNLELYTNNTELTDLTILAPYDSPNTDGVDVHGMYVGVSATPAT